jgi:hypothetical protein
MRLNFEHWWPLMRPSGAKDNLARFVQARVVTDERLHQQKVDQVLEALVLFPGEGGNGMPCNF